MANLHPNTRIPRAAKGFAFAASIALLSLHLPKAGAQSTTDTSEADGFFLELDSYVNYGGKIAVISGKTGEGYHRGSEVVKTVHASVPKIMGGLHHLMLRHEIAHMNYHLNLGAIKRGSPRHADTKIRARSLLPRLGRLALPQADRSGQHTGRRNFSSQRTRRLASRRTQRRQPRQRILSAHTLQHR